MLSQRSLARVSSTVCVVLIGGLVARGPAVADDTQIDRDIRPTDSTDERHWAFVPPVRPAPPDMQDAAWPQSPLDRFVLARLEQEGLRPAERASRETLIRRATFDLIGLPPTPAEIAAFVTDDRPDAYRRLVDRLLDSPHYGERWGRHWLDVARYADSGGFETDIFFGHAWRYRDYVIKSLNADKPFDQFIREQIAGDELYPGDPEARIATGLFTIGPILQEADMVEGKLDYDLLTDAVDTTGSAFLGLTLACARCHDHKYDPVSQREYFRLQAIFAASEQHDFDESGKLLRSGVAMRKTIDEFKLEQVRARAGDLDEGPEREEYLREIGEHYIEQDDDLQERVEASEAYAAYRRAVRRYRQAAEHESAPAEAELEALLEEVGEQALELAGRESRRGVRRLSRDERRAYLIDYGRKHLDLDAPEGLIEDVDAFRLQVGKQHLNDESVIPVRALAHRDEPLEVRVLGRGELTSPGEVVSPGFPAVIGGGDRPEGLSPGKWLTALAEWIACEENPLTARVIVNRVWQWHFGAGLVRTPNDFGTRGDPPTHPELLDWLAIEFVEHGWSLKHLHRVIMLSNTYQMSSLADHETLARDPENRLLGRYQPHRLEAEAIWDSLRAVSGTLNRQMYGLPFAPPLDEQEEIGNYKDWPTSTPDQCNRRGVYLLTRRSFRFPMLSSFDLPDNATSCGRRDVTTVPNQCLTLLNNRTIAEQAEAFAARLVRETDGELTEIAPLAWKYAYGREMTDAERRHVSEFLTNRREELTGEADDPRARSIEELCLAIFNTNEFIYVR